MGKRRNLRLATLLPPPEPRTVQPGDRERELQKEGKMTQALIDSRTGPLSLMAIAHRFTLKIKPRKWL